VGIRPGRVFTGWFVLVVLYTALTESDRLTQALGIGNSALTALSDPTRPLIRDHSATTAPTGTPAPDWHVGMDPAQNQAHPGTQTPAPYAPGVTPPPDPFPAFLQRH
jgi:hypothetical protein